MKTAENSPKIEVQLLSERVYELIKEKILNLSYKPGERLVEQNLAVEFGISKSPIRDALQRLERENLVYMIPFIGSHAAKISKREYAEIHQLREALETFCLNGGIGSYTEEDINQFRKVMESAKKKLAEGDAVGAFGDHFHFHFLIIEKFKNTSIISIYSALSDKIKRYINVAQKYIPSRLKLAHEEHIKLLKAIEKKDAGLAVDELKMHLLQVMNSYLKPNDIENFE